MIPGEIFPSPGQLTLNERTKAVVLMVANTGDRPVQVGRHYHFSKANPALDFDRGGSAQHAVGYCRRNYGAL